MEVSGLIIVYNLFCMYILVMEVSGLIIAYNLFCRSVRFVKNMVLLSVVQLGVVKVFITSLVLWRKVHTHMYMH